MKCLFTLLLLYVCIVNCLYASVPDSLCGREIIREPLFFPIRFEWFMDTSTVHYSNDGVLYYNMQVATDSLYTHIIYENKSVPDKYNGTQRILPDTTTFIVEESKFWQYFTPYWWRVRSWKDSTKVSAWSCGSTKNFFVRDPSYTNPFMLKIPIKYSVKNISLVNISIFDNSNQFVMELINMKHNKGTYTCILDISFDELFYNLFLMSKI